MKILNLKIIKTFYFTILIILFSKLSFAETFFCEVKKHALFVANDNNEFFISQVNSKNFKFQIDGNYIKFTNHLRNIDNIVIVDSSNDLRTFNAKTSSGHTNIYFDNGNLITSNSLHPIGLNVIASFCEKF